MKRSPSDNDDLTVVNIKNSLNASFREQLFTVLCCGKHAHLLLGVVDKAWALSIWKHMVLIEIKDVARKKVGLEIF